MTEPESTETRRFVWPADYYAAPTPHTAVPRGLALGCGGASILVLLLVFVGGAFLSGGGFAQFLDLTLGMSVGEMRGMYAGDVSAARKKSLEGEIETMRTRLRDEKLSVPNVQPFLVSMRDAMSDKRVTEAEAAKVEQTAREVSAKAKK
jgi:hypothetical protein